MRIAFWKPAFPEYQLVILNTSAGRSFRGFLIRHVNGYAVLNQAELLSDDGPTKLDGQVLVPQNQIEFLQVVK